MEEQNHPLEVIYPRGGKHFILRWWNNEDQHKIIVTNNLESLIVVAKKAFLEHDDLRVVDLHRVEIVAPSEKLCKQATILMHEHNVRSFFEDVVYDIYDVVQKNKEGWLPLDFRWCPKIVGEKNNHYCDDGSCLCGLRLSKNMTEQKFYDKYFAAWNSEMVPLRHRMSVRPSQARSCYRSKPVYSKAEQAKDTNMVWVASTHFGNYSSGVMLYKLDKGFTHIDQIYWPALFYYRSPKKLGLTFIKRELQEVEQKIQKDIRERVDQEAAKREEMFGKRALETYYFFARNS